MKSLVSIGSGEQEEEDGEEKDNDHDDDDEFVAVVKHIDASETDDEGSDEEDIFEDVQEVGDETIASSD